MMVDLLKTSNDEKVLLALLSWFKTISELEDEREVLTIKIILNKIKFNTSIPIAFECQLDKLNILYIGFY